MQAGLAMDPNRAFQALNAETLEQASENVDYPVPPQNVSPPVHCGSHSKTRTLGGAGN